MRTGRIRLKVFLVSAVILTVSLILNFLLNMSSFEEVFRTSLSSRYILINRNLTKKIETAVNLGKPLHKFSGIEIFFDEIINDDKNISNVFITSKQGNVYYSYDESYINREIIDSLLPKNSDEKVKVAQAANNYYISSAIYSDNSETANNQIEGYVFIEFPKSVISKEVRAMVWENWNIFLNTLTITVLLLALFIIFIRSSREKVYFIFILIVFFVSQLFYSYINIDYFRNKYTSILNENIANFSKAIDSEIKYFSDLGLKLNRLNGFEKYLSREIKEVPEAKEILITDRSQNILYMADFEDKTKTIFQKEIGKLNITSTKNQSYRRANFNYNKNSKGTIFILLNEKIIAKKTMELLLDAGTVLIISLIISYQLLLFATMKRVNKKDEELAEKATLENEKIIIQLISFIFYFGEMMPISFMPLLIEKIHHNNPMYILGLSVNATLSFPITTYMFGSAISVLVVGYLAGKISERKILSQCTVLLIIGAVGAALSTSIPSLAFFRFLSGLGFGGITINSTALILKSFKHGNVAIGFGYWASGYGAASICALPIGGVLVYRFGFVTALLCSAIIAFLLLVFSLIYMRRLAIAKSIVHENRKEEISEEKQTEKLSNLSFKETLNIFNDKNVFANFFFRLVPFHLVYVGVFQFMMPLTMNKEGISQANIGRVMTIFGIVYLLMPIVSKLVARIKNDRLFITAGSLIIGSFLLILKFSNGIVAFVLVITGISLGSMIADAAEESFITSTQKAKDIGETKFMSIYNSYERFIMVVSPLICSFFITIFGFSVSIFLIGIITISSSIIYLFVSATAQKVKS